MEPLSSENLEAPIQDKPASLTRRHFLKGALIVSTSAVAAGCAPVAPPNPPATPVHPLNEKYPEVPPAPTAAPSGNALIFLQWKKLG